LDPAIPNEQLERYIEFFRARLNAVIHFIIEGDAPRAIAVYTAMDKVLDYYWPIPLRDSWGLRGTDLGVLEEDLTKTTIFAIMHFNPKDRIPESPVCI
jgi:hypothetical protein